MAEPEFQSRHPGSRVHALHLHVEDTQVRGGRVCEEVISQLALGYICPQTQEREHRVRKQGQIYECLQRDVFADHTQRGAAEM